MKKIFRKFIDFFLRFFNLEISRIKTRNFDTICKEIFENCGIQPQVIVDVGGHKGESVKRFQKLFIDGFVFSFEPNLNLLPYKLPGISPEKFCSIPLAVGRDDSKVVLRLHNTSTGSSSLLEYDEETRFAKRRNLSEETVSKLEVQQISVGSFYESLKSLNKNEKKDFIAKYSANYINYLRSNAVNLYKNSVWTGGVDLN